MQFKLLMLRLIGLCKIKMTVKSNSFIYENGDFHDYYKTSFNSPIIQLSPVCYEFSILESWSFTSIIKHQYGV